MILSQPLSDCSGVWANPPMPAMLHRLVMCPAPRGPATRRRRPHPRRSRRSAPRWRARRPRRPRALISAATASMASAATSRQATAAPSAARRRAVARPMPEPAAGDQRHPAGVAARGDRLGGGPPVGIGLPDSCGGAHARSFSSASPVGPLPSTPEPGRRFRARSGAPLLRPPCAPGRRGGPGRPSSSGSAAARRPRPARRGPCSRRAAGRSARAARPARVPRPRAATTTATPTSPRTSSGTPTTATRATAGCEERASSTSAG